MNVFDLYNLIKPMISRSQSSLNELLRSEFKDIQHIKTTSINKNYMFNDQISNKFYNALGISKENLRSLINKYVTSTKNFDSLDPNNIMLMFLMRYGFETGQNVLVKMAYEIFLYKNFYPIFTNYFKYGVDESAFEYFKSTLNSKYELSKQENLYATVDVIGKRNFDKYSEFLYKNSEKDFLLIPVNTKTRLNQFVKELMKVYKPFIEKNKVHLNASRDLEDEEGGTFNDQMYNNNSIDHEFKNRINLFVIHNELPEMFLRKIASGMNKSTLEDVKDIYHNIIMNKDLVDKIADIFIDNRIKNVPIEDKSVINKWILEVSKHKPEDYVLEIDKMIEKYTPELDISQKSSLIEKRKIFILLVYLIILKSKL